METQCVTELESCFTNHIIQWIKRTDKIKVGEQLPHLGQPEASTSHFAPSGMIPAGLEEQERSF